VSLLIAVLLPVIILLVAQYRSLAGLEGKTRAAVQENLRQTLSMLNFPRRQDRAVIVVCFHHD